MEHSDSQLWEEGFVPLSDVDVEPVMSGEALSAHEDPTELIHPTGISTTWESQHPLNQEYFGPRTLTPYGAPDPATTLEQSMHDYSETPHTCDTTTFGYPHPSQAVSSQHAMQAQEIDTAEVGHQFANQTGTCTQANVPSITNDQNQYPTSQYHRILFDQGKNPASSHNSPSMWFLTPSSMLDPETAFWNPDSTLSTSDSASRVDEEDVSRREQLKF